MPFRPKKSDIDDHPDLLNGNSKNGSNIVDNLETKANGM